MLRAVSGNGEPLPAPVLIFSVVLDRAEDDPNHPHRAAYWRNQQWLLQHHEEVLPPSRGKYLAVAGQEAFTGNSAAEARARAQAAHPHDPGILLHYVTTPGMEAAPDGVRW